ncbi:dipeptide ABC transporter ATP-binding protein [Tropicimonas sp.]|uniref:dipeptide ABC transporter ATP-binding protein n=1 Tax=Tropicimonas sp. TaxID=2067044 RepID=UPI003A8B17E2
MTWQLSVENLSVSYRDEGVERALLRQVSVNLRGGEILGLVGESGSGKSLLCRTVMGLLPSRKLHVTGGRILLDGVELSDPAAVRALRGRRIGMIFQNPTSHLDPVMTIGRQIAEGLAKHRGLSRREVRREGVALLDQVGFPDPARAWSSYAHAFSGGMRQRAMIAIALSCDPEILIADEPTTALDVTIQAQILRLLMDLRDRRGLSIILVTHDLGVVAQTCDRIAVMKDGEIVETGEKRGLLSKPMHPYTQQLIASHPSLSKAGEQVPVHSHDKQPLFRVTDLRVAFRTGGLPGRRRVFPALKDISLDIWPGETVGIVGESGSGKSTLARTMLGLNPITRGEVSFEGQSLVGDRSAALAALRRDAAMVFQDPFNSLNPRMTIGRTLAEVLRTQGETPRARIPERIVELLEMVGLDHTFAARRPRSLSGGQCQRAGIARALAVNPRVILADECVAALDVTIQAQIVALFRKLTEERGLTLIFIAHDLAIVRNLCERVVVMHHGEIVEDGPSARVFDRPRCDYTAALIAAIPDIDPNRPINGGARPTQEPQQEYAI